VLAAAAFVSVSVSFDVARVDGAIGAQSGGSSVFDEARERSSRPSVVAGDGDGDEEDSRAEYDGDGDGDGDGAPAVTAVAGGALVAPLADDDGVDGVDGAVDRSHSFGMPPFDDDDDDDDESDAGR